MEDEFILQEWLRSRLTQELDFEVPDEMVSYVFGIKDNNDLSKCLNGLLDPKKASTRKLIDEFIKRKRLINCKPKTSTKYDDVVEKYSINSKKKRSQLNVSGPAHKNTDDNLPSNDSNKKKNKFKSVPIKDPSSILLDGRVCCNCEAKKHKLVNNCLTCGRIVCEQEGSGPCYVCGSLVCTYEESAKINEDVQCGTKLYEQLLTKEKPKDLVNAIEVRDRLLDYDKNMRKHTHVFDDDNDYFCTANPWLTVVEREQIKKQEEEFFSEKYKSRKNKLLTLNILGNATTQEKVEERKTDSKIINEIQNARNSFAQTLPSRPIEDVIDPYFVNLNVQFTSKIQADHTQVNNNNNKKVFPSRILDEALYELSDTGCCLSIQQPWASLLVHGIRSGEGRTWYTNHRGRLWIASSNNRVSAEDIAEIENKYRMIKGDIEFPNNYPFGCLLGCVTLVECLTQEQYSINYPTGEIDDPYVFVCANSMILPINYPIKGATNIYYLDQKIHQAAINSLQSINK